MKSQLSSCQRENSHLQLEEHLPWHSFQRHPDLLTNSKGLNYFLFPPFFPPISALCSFYLFQRGIEETQLAQTVSWWSLS